MRSFSRRLARPSSAARAIFGVLLALSFAQESEPVERPISAQLHLHGSFSEGRASIDSHCYEAAELGVDVLWWSDHDFRVTSFQGVSHYDFEEWTQRADEGEAWSARWDKGPNTKGLVAPKAYREPHGTAELVTTRSRRGEKSLRVTSTDDGDEFSRYDVRFTTSDKTHQRSVASRPTLGISVFPQALGPDARAYVHVLLSEHAPYEDLPITQYSLRYVLGVDGGEPRTAGAERRIPVPVRPGEWNDLAFDLVADIRAAFGNFHPEDNALQRIEFGVETRRGATAEVFFDELGISTKVPGEKMFERQRELLREVGADYPSLTQLQGVEISHGLNHLNEFSPDTELLDLDALEAEVEGEGPDAIIAFQELVFDRAIPRAHAKGGLISYNHMFGITPASRSASANSRKVHRDLLDHRAWGADILEVGYRERGGALLSEHLWVWDELAVDGLRIVGTGVSDSHGSSIGRWRGTPNNFVSWIWATAPEKEALIDGLRRGRVFFGDIEHFDGSFDLLAPQGWRMGNEVFTDAAKVEVQVRIEGIRGAGAVHLVRNGKTIRRKAVEPGTHDHTYSVPLFDDQDCVVRAELHDDEHGPIVFSNPIYFPRRPAEGGARPEVTRIDVAGLVSERVERFRLVSAVDDGAAVTLRGIGQAGELDLDVSAFGTPAAIELDGLALTWELAGSILRLLEMQGEGALRIVR